MKKLLFKTSVLILFSTTLNSQEKFDDYTLEYFEKNYSIEVSQDKKDTSKISFYIDCYSADKLRDKVNLIVRSKNLNDFKEYLTTIKTTYVKWDSIAKSNKVTEIEKDFDIKQFRCESGFKYGGWEFDFNTLIRARAKIIKDKLRVILRSSELVSSSNQFMKHDGFIFVFSSPEEIDKFIEKLNLQKAKEKFNSVNKTNDLFK